MGRVVYLDMRAVIAEYERGDSLPMIGRRHGVHFATIARRLKAAGVKVRTQTEGQRARYNRGDVAGLALDLRLSEDVVAELLVRHGFIEVEQAKGGEGCKGETQAGGSRPARATGAGSSTRSKAR